MCSCGETFNVVHVVKFARFENFLMKIVGKKTSDESLDEEKLYGVYFALQIVDNYRIMVLKEAASNRHYKIVII